MCIGQLLRTGGDCPIDEFENVQERNFHVLIFGLIYKTTKTLKGFE